MSLCGTTYSARARWRWETWRLKLDKRRKWCQYGYANQWWERNQCTVVWSPTTCDDLENAWHITQVTQTGGGKWKNNIQDEEKPIFYVILVPVMFASRCNKCIPCACTISGRTRTNNGGSTSSRKMLTVLSCKVSHMYIICIIIRGMYTEHANSKIVSTTREEEDVQKPGIPRGKP